MRYYIILIIIAIVALFAGLTLAQDTPQRPKWLLGFETEFSYSQSGLHQAYPDNYYHFSATPRSQRILSDHVALGAFTILTWAKQGQNEYTAFGVGPMASFYLQDITRRTVPFIDVYAGYWHYNATSYNYIWTKSSTDMYPDALLLNRIPDANDHDRFHAGFNIGFLHHISSALALISSAGFGFTSDLSPKTVYDPTPFGNGFNLDVGEQPFRTTAPYESTNINIILRVGLVTFL